MGPMRTELNWSQCYEQVIFPSDDVKLKLKLLGTLKVRWPKQKPAKQENLSGEPWYQVTNLILGVLGSLGIQWYLWYPWQLVSLASGN